MVSQLQLRLAPHHFDVQIQALAARAAVPGKCHARSVRRKCRRRFYSRKGREWAQPGARRIIVLTAPAIDSNRHQNQIRASYRNHNESVRQPDAAGMRRPAWACTFERPAGLSGEVDRADEPVTPPREGFHEFRFFGRVGQRRPHFVHCGRQAVIEVDEGVVRPQFPPDILPADNVAGDYATTARAVERVAAEAGFCARLCVVRRYPYPPDTGRTG